jgi:hypothetical protein
MDNLQNYHDSIYENEFLNVFNLNAKISINEFISKNKISKKKESMVKLKLSIKI